MNFNKYFESIPNAATVTKEDSQKVLKIINKIEESFIKQFDDINYVCQVDFQGQALELFDKTKARLQKVGFKCEETGNDNFKTLLVSIPDEYKDCNNIVFPQLSAEDEILEYLHENYNVPNLVCAMENLNELAVGYARGLQYDFIQKISKLKESKANYFVIDLPKTTTDVVSVFIKTVEQKGYFTFRDHDVLYISNEFAVIEQLMEEACESLQ